MESRKMVLRSGEQNSSGEANIENDLWTWVEGRKERVRRMERVAWKHIHYHM